MPEAKKFDPFKPSQPAIPGVPNPHSGQGPNAPDRVVSWLALLVVAILILGAGAFHRIRNSSARDTSRGAEVAPITDLGPPASVPKSAENLAVGPGPVARTSDLARAWSSKQFLFPDPITNQPMPAMVVRLPQGQLWGFSLREPFGGCPLEYVTDVKRLQSDYEIRADHPMVGDPCNRTVFDLLKYGPGPSSDALVRGAIVQGPGLRPPIAIEIRTEGNQVVAVRAE